MPWRVVWFRPQLPTGAGIFLSRGRWAGVSFAARAATSVGIADDTIQHLSMLRIVWAAASAAADAFRAADNPVDEELVADLERMVERTRLEIERLAAILARPS